MMGSTNDVDDAGAGLVDAVVSDDVIVVPPRSC